MPNSSKPNIRVVVTVFAALALGVLAYSFSWSQDKPSRDPSRLANLLSRFQKLDRNQDDSITKAEAGDAIWARFKRADLNQDGRITKDELKNGFSQQNPAIRNSKKPAKPKGFDASHVYKKVGERELNLFVYLPQKRKPNSQSPAIVFFHGGGWRAGTPAAFERQCQYFRNRGMVAITVEYRLITQHPIKIDACVEDAISAMRWVRKNASKLDINPNRIASSGGSAGGHLAACVGLVGSTERQKTDDSQIDYRPNAMVLFNPAMALAPDRRMDPAMLKQATTVAKNQTRGDAKMVSPLANSRSKHVPCIMFFGTNDRLLTPAKWFYEDSVAAGNQCELKTYPDQGHGFFNRGAAFEDTLKEADQFLVKLGWLPTKKSHK